MIEYLVVFELDVYDPEVQDRNLYRSVKALNRLIAKKEVENYFLGLGLIGEVVSIEENRVERGL